MLRHSLTEFDMHWQIIYFTTNLLSRYVHTRFGSCKSQPLTHWIYQFQFLVFSLIKSFRWFVVCHTGVVRIETKQQCLAVHRPTGGLREPPERKLDNIRPGSTSMIRHNFALWIKCTSPPAVRLACNQGPRICSNYCRSAPGYGYRTKKATSPLIWHMASKSLWIIFGNCSVILLLLQNIHTLVTSWRYGHGLNGIHL